MADLPLIIADDDSIICFDHHYTTIRKNELLAGSCSTYLFEQVVMLFPVEPCFPIHIYLTNPLIDLL